VAGQEKDRNSRAATEGLQGAGIDWIRLTSWGNKLNNGPTVEPESVTLIA